MTYLGRQKELKGETLEIKSFFDQLNANSKILITLDYWQMTGSDKHLKMIKK